METTDGAFRARTRSSLLAWFRLFRLNRTMMVALITGTGAYTSGAGLERSLWIALAGWFLAVGGFSLDLYADRDLDRQGPRAHARRNPLADGSLPPRVGLVFSLSFIAVSLPLALWVTPWALLPWSLILAVVAGLAWHLFETPFLRALTLGLLQALYLLMGGTAGRLSLALVLLAAMFFFAMLGGRGMIDIRDFPQDEPSRVQTLPKRYGIQATARFTAVALFVAYALSLAAYWSGEFGPLYLYLDLAYVVIGVACAVLFAVRPTPRLAGILTVVFMMGEGTLISLAMVLGTVYR